MNKFALCFQLATVLLACFVTSSNGAAVPGQLFEGEPELRGPDAKKQPQLLLTNGEKGNKPQLLLTNGEKGNKPTLPLTNGEPQKKAQTPGGLSAEMKSGKGEPKRPDMPKTTPLAPGGPVVTLDEPYVAADKGYQQKIGQCDRFCRNNKKQVYVGSRYFESLRGQEVCRCFLSDYMTYTDYDVKTQVQPTANKRTKNSKP